MNSRMIAIPPVSELDYHRQSAQLDSLFRNSPNGVAVLENAGRWSTFMATAPEKLATHSPWEFVRDVPTDLRARLKQALEDRKPLLDVELTMKSAANSPDERHLLAHFGMRGGGESHHRNGAGGCYGAQDRRRSLACFRGALSRRCGTFRLWSMQREFERVGTRSEWRDASYSWLLVAGRTGRRQHFAGRFPLFGSAGATVCELLPARLVRDILDGETKPTSS